jgi:hypothetical protein
MTEQKTCVRIDCHVLADILGISSNLVFDRDDDLVEADLIIHEGYRSVEQRRLSHELSLVRALADNLAKEKADLQAEVERHATRINFLESDLAVEKKSNDVLAARLRVKNSTPKPAAKPAAKPRVKK